MKRNRPIQATVLALLSILLLSVGVAAPSSAAPTKNGTDDTRAQAFWDKWGVAKKTQAELRKKAATGTFLDADIAGSSPISTDVLERDGSRSTVQTFVDGSISVSSIELPQEAISAHGGVTTLAAIGQCTTYGGAGWASYQNCLVAHETSTISISFRATYEKYQGANAQIPSHCCGSITTYGGVSVSDPIRNTYYVRDSGTYGQAVVTYTAAVKSWNGAYSEVIALSLRVSTNGSASVTTY